MASTQRFLALLTTLSLVGPFAPGLLAEEASVGPLPDGPDFKEVLSVPGVGSVSISPDGSAVVYEVTTTDWDENRYDTELWLVREEEEPHQLTRTRDGSSTGAAFSPDGRWIAFLADRGESTQIHLLPTRGGEARQLTSVEDGVGSFEWSPTGAQMAVSIADPLAEDREKRDEMYGAFSIEDASFRMTHFWLLDVEAALSSDKGATLPAEGDEEGESDESAEDEAEDDVDAAEPEPFRRLTGGDYTVSGGSFSPDGARIAFAHRPDTRIESFENSDISIVEVASGEITPLVERPAFDGNPIWSPDGAWILFDTADGDFNYFANSELARLPSAGGEIEILTAEFDEDASGIAWLDDGIRFSALEAPARRIFRLDPETGQTDALTADPPTVWSVDISRDGSTMAFGAEGPERIEEVYLAAADGTGLRRLTDRTAEISDWATGGREMVRWTSRDGAEIEGVLLTPPGFDREEKHPLLVIIHGGPAWLSMPYKLYTYVYPVQQWLAKGAVILMPNYRGSAGYGEAFRSLNVRNLGVGDAWDVLSGVEHLIEQGFVDPERMGAMGWSQGGYISAFLATTSDAFQALSVGAGISNWMTYYVNTDIHPFTHYYLEGNPWEDPEVYAKTSPMTYILDAVTPTLIQHGENDARVPTPNAYELYQGLQDVGVETRLIIYKGFGHGITKPKERLAAVWHNWQWFAKHVWGEEVELPLE